MDSPRVPWLLILTLVFLSNNLSLAKHEINKKLPSAVVVGTVYCDTCFQRDFSRTSHFISGASVSVECRNGNSKPSFQKEVKTNEHGVFKIPLPVAIGKHVKRIKQCSVKLISSSEPFCAVASSATSSSLRLKSRKEGTHIFSAGFFTFKPLKQPDMCNQKPSFANSRDLSNNKDISPNPDIPTFPPETQNPTLPNLPPLPITLPNLPSIPSIPPIPQIPTIPKVPPIPNLGQQPNVPIQPKETDDKASRPTFFFSPPTIPLLPSPPTIPLLPSPPPLFGFPLPPNPFLPPAPLLPNPFQPPPAPLLPNPFQPPPAPLLPNPFQPPPPSFSFPPILPPIPGLSPPPSPPPPRFPFPFPPLPFPPSPGIPPASTSEKTSP